MPAALGSSFKRDLGRVNGGYPVLVWQDSECTSHIGGTPVVENEIPAACIRNGSHDEVVYCTICDAEVSRDTVTDKALGHKWNTGVVTVQPTIAKEGVMTFTCAVCKAVKTEAVAKLAEEQKDQSAANDVINLINSIGSVSKDSKDKIDAARKAYDSLTTAQQKLVGNYTVLTTAETTYAGLPAVKADQEAADAAIAKINAIGTVTRGSKSLIDAEATYASLPTRHGTGNTADSTQPAQSSRTGDMGIAVYAAMSLLSVTGGAWVIGRKRRQ